MESLHRARRHAGPGADRRHARRARSSRPGWPRSGRGHGTGLLTAIERRTDERLASLTAKLAARQEDERRRIITGADRFAATLRKALAESEAEEDALFSVVEGRGDEREIAQCRRDRENWQDKLDALEAKRDRELARVAARYREITAAQLPGRGDLRRAAPGGDPMSPAAPSRGWLPPSPPRSHRQGSPQAHIEWLKLIEVSGPFLSVPVLTAEWPDLEPLDTRGPRQAAPGAPAVAGRPSAQPCRLDRLRARGTARLGGRWSSRDDLDRLALDVPEHETTLIPSFTLDRPGTGDVRPARPGQRRLPGGAGQRLGLASHPRRPARPAVPPPRRRAGPGHRRPLVGAGVGPGGGRHHRGRVRRDLLARISERDVVRAFISLLQRRRFFAVPEDRQLPALLRESLKNQEEITDPLGVQVRQAVELLVAAFGRADADARDRGQPGLSDVTRTRCTAARSP